MVCPSQKCSYRIVWAVWSPQWLLLKSVSYIFMHMKVRSRMTGLSFQAAVHNIACWRLSNKIVSFHSHICQEQKGEKWLQDTDRREMQAGTSIFKYLT